MSEWKEYKLGDLIKTNVKSIGKSYPYSKILYLDTGSITCNSIISYQEFELDKAPSRARRLVKEDDIIYSSVRPNQLHYGYIKNPQENLVISTGFVTITCDKEWLYPKFLYYYLTQSYITEYLHSVAEASTSTYPSLKPSDIEALNIEIPSLSEQKQIASILSSLDDKIDLLNRENVTLEAMAETLFRQRFIEEAKEDWEEKELEEVVNIAIGRTPPRKESKWFSSNPKDMKWLSIKDMGSAGAFLFDTSEFLTQEAVERFGIPIIPKDTVVLSFKMTIGRVGITTEEMLSNEAIAHFKFRSTTPFTKEYLYLFLKTYKYDLLGTTSSIVTSINSAMIKQIRIPIPDTEIMERFKEQTNCIFNKIYNNQRQVITLSNQRDTLLPKLMSNEIAI